MRYFAADGRIATAPLAGGIEITAAQYRKALAGIAAGRLVAVAGGVFAVVDPPPLPEPEPEPEPEPVPPTRRTLTKQQWIYGMERSGLGPALYEALEALPRGDEGRAALRAYLDGSQSFERDDLDDLLSTYAGSLPASIGNLTEAQIDEIWETAAGWTGRRGR